MSDCETTAVPKISFKSSKKRQVRQRKESSGTFYSLSTIYSNFFILSLFFLIFLHYRLIFFCITFLFSPPFFLVCSSYDSRCTHIHKIPNFRNIPCSPKKSLRSSLQPS